MGRLAGLTSITLVMTVFQRKRKLLRVWRQIRPLLLMQDNAADTDILTLALASSAGTTDTLTYAMSGPAGDDDCRCCRNKRCGDVSMFLVTRQRRLLLPCERIPWSLNITTSTYGTTANFSGAEAITVDTAIEAATINVTATGAFTMNATASSCRADNYSNKCCS